MALCGIAWGLGFLTKGFVALALLGVALALFLPWEGRAREGPGLAVLPLAVAAAFAAPWAFCVHPRGFWLLWP